MDCVVDMAQTYTAHGGDHSPSEDHGQHRPSDQEAASYESAQCVDEEAGALFFQLLHFDQLRFSEVAEVCLLARRVGIARAPHKIVHQSPAPIDAALERVGLRKEHPLDGVKYQLDALLCRHACLNAESGRKVTSFLRLHPG